MHRGLPVVDNAAGYMLNEGSIDPSNSPRDRTHSTFMSEKLTAQIIADAKKWGIVRRLENIQQSVARPREQPLDYLADEILESQVGCYADG